MKKRLISSYDMANDTFAGKFDDEKGLSSDYSLCEGVFLGLDRNNFPNSVYIGGASEVLNIPKEVLENPNVKIFIDCNDAFLDFCMFIEGLKIFSIRCKNRFGIPQISFSIDSNY